MFRLFVQFRRSGPAVILAGALTLAGCSSPQVSPVPVEGQVLFHGAPVKNVNVAFSTDRGRPAFGMTDDTGHFKLTTFETHDGAFPGRYHVVITKPTMGDINMVVPPKPDFLKTSAELGYPAKFADPARSNLTFEVKRGEPNSFTIELKE